MVPTKILLVEVNQLLRKGLVALLEHESWIHVVTDIGDYQGAFTALKGLKPDVVVIDLDVLGEGTGKAILEMKAVQPSVAVVVLCAHDNDEVIFTAAKAGARGFVLKDAEVDDLLLAIRLSSSGQGYIAPTIAVRFLNRFAVMADGEATRARHDFLTDREKHILQLVARGETNREIALSLMISEHTVKVHVRSIFEKLQLRNRQEATAYAYKRRMVPITGLATLVSGSIVMLQSPLSCLLAI